VRVTSDRSATCRNCGRAATRLDRQRWCDRCRREVVRRASRAARIVAIVAALLLMAWILLFVGPTPRFLMGWLVLIAAVYFFVYKLAQRVAFEVVRGRGVPPPEEQKEEPHA
jgi:amino acid transporter